MDPERRDAGPQGMVGKSQRRAVDRDDRVADVFVQRAALRLNDVRARGDFFMHSTKREGDSFF